MSNENYWQKERDVDASYSDDITNFIRIGDGSQLSGHFNRDRRNQSGDTPLIEAIKLNQEKIAITLLKLGANPFIQGVDGTKPYNLAVEQDMAELTAAMLSYAGTEKLWIQGQEERFSNSHHQKNYDLSEMATA